jgi:hypothetical protein
MIAGRVHSMHHKLLVSLVHKMHPTFDDTITITTANRCVERKARRIARERCADYRVYAGVILETLLLKSPPSPSIDKYAMLLSL